MVNILVTICNTVIWSCWNSETFTFKCTESFKHVFKLKFNSQTITITNKTHTLWKTQNSIESVL